ncbi:non-ribosomal peptide synthetase [Amycolatopsis orientalis]|uniref:Phenyloxazoline synthase MbtB n=1 Tax=Amycolatopsis orientalis TaxID=31958 RepID=A0A193BTH0_AMYOR|nr:non-ribosomal peptide synthetase [Amycolatopsis orientalis]ANN15485.1 non-ribosomal peptide synthetase [Amycolatopsis orientalis]
MTEQIIDELRALGVRLWAEAGQLRFRAPRGVLTDAHKATLKANKATILALLRTDEQAISHDAEARHEPFPLTDVQTAYLLGRQDPFGYGGVACHGYLEVAYPGLEPERVEEAWNILVARHDMLRAVVEPDGYQHVLPEVPRFRVGRSEDPAAVRAELGHRVHETTRWPLFDLHVTPGTLHISMDSLIADWASAGILLGELETLLADPHAELPPLDITFRDHLLAERALRDTDRYRRDREYWQARVDELPAAPELPRKPGESTGPVRFERRHTRLDAPTWTALCERAKQYGLTPSNVVLAAYADVLRRWSRRPRFGLNLTLLNRRPTHPQVDKLVGDFTSVTLLAVENQAGQPFHERARGLAERLFTDLDHRLFSGVEVVREIARRRGREAALMPVVFTSGIGLGSGDRPTGYGITQTPQVFLDCQVTDDAGGLAISWDVRRGIFPDGLIDDMFAAFETHLLGLAASGDAWEGTGPVPLPEWQAAERAAVNDTAAPLPETSLHEEFFARAAREPEAIAVTGPAGTLTYGELARRAGAVAEALRGKELDRVAVVMDKGPEQVAAVLGILLAGGAYLPVDTTQPALRREKVLALAGVRVVLSQSWVGRPDGVEVIDVDTLEPADEIPGVKPGDPDALAYVIYTSGSTGEPKGVMITHRAARNTIEDITRRFGVTDGDRVLGLAQLGFDLSVYDIFGTLSAGAALVLPDAGRPGDPSHWARLVADHGVTVWNSVPAQLQMLANYLESEPLAIPSLRLALLSGDWIPVTLPAQFAKLANAGLVSLGGATEAAIWSIFHPIEEVDPEWVSIPYGKPLTNQGFRILDESYHDCPVWTPGELYIIGAGLALGYFGDEDLTASRFVTHDGTRLYRTGDLGRYLPGGEIEFLGREDDQVKLRGHRIELGEVESALLAHEDVGAAAVVLTGDRHGERALLGFAEPARKSEKDGVPPRLAETVRKFADRQVAGIGEDQVAEHVGDLHEAALLSMLTALTERGAFETPQDADGVLETARIHEQHHWLVRRWLVLLTAAGKLGFDGHYTCLADATPELVAEAWRRVERGLATPEFVRYHELHVEHIHALLDGDQNPFELLFPEGRLDTARAIYRDDTITRYLNHGAAALLNRIAAASDRPLRVLEAGAGTGATTSAVLPMLEGFDVDYLFTDLTPFFLTPAREEFPRARFGLFDLDQEFRAQGYAPNSFDVVLCAGVLNSTRDPAAAIAAATELLAPGGWLVFTEPTEEHPHILLTQGFMMEPGGGDHRTGATPLLSTEDWLSLVDADVVLPGDGHPQAAQGMRLFATRVKTDRCHVTAGDLTAFLAERLPAHMVPAHVQVVDELPLTGNGKVDRKTLAGWRPVLPDDDLAAEDGPPDELEGRLTALWAGALGLPRIGRDDNFYDRGADSLVLARVAGRLREEIPEAGPFTYDTLLRQMLNEPTVSALARALRAQPLSTPVDDSDRSGNALLIPFGGGEEGPARVLFHAALGTLDYFQSLGKALAAQELGPVIGVAVADQEAYCEIDPKRLIGRVADDYADRLLAAGRTRFQLIGYCLGGLLATEVARRLLERGVPVDDLTLVDSIPMFLETGEELAFEAIFVPNLNLDPVAAVFGSDVDSADVYRAIEKLMTDHDRNVPAGAMGALTGDPGLEAVAAAVRRRHELDQETRLAQYAEAASKQAGIPVDPELVPALFRVCRHSMRAARYDPEPYVGDMTFLRATEQQSFGVTAGVGHLAAPFWEQTCLGEFTVIDVPGNHFSVIEPPNVDVVVAHLGAAITSGVTA